MVHLGTIYNAAGEDVTELVRTGQYALGERANDYLNRILCSSANRCEDCLDGAQQDTKIIA